MLSIHKQNTHFSKEREKWWVWNREGNFVLGNANGPFSFFLFTYLVTKNNNFDLPISLLVLIFSCM